MRFFTAAVLSLLFSSLPARAVIKAATPPDSLYNSCPTVVAGTVTKFSADTGNLEAAANTLKGTPVGDVVRFKIEGLPAITARIKVGDPLVLFVARVDKNAAVHLADVWLAPIKKGPGLYSIAAEKDLRQSYPGTTATLHRLVTNLKEGKYDMLNAVHPDNFQGGVKDIGKIDPATALFAARLAGDKHSSLIAVTPAGAKAMTVSTTAIAAAASPAPTVSADTLALATLDLPTGPNATAARTLFTLTKTGALDISDSSGLSSKLWPDGSSAVAAAIGLFAEDNKPGAFVVKDAGLFLRTFAAPDDQIPADFTRLTGERLETYFKGDKPLAHATVAPLDVNGDGRTDLLLHTPERTLLLINRGYGAFFINPDLDKILIDSAGKPLLSDKTPWTCLDIDGDGHDDLLFLSPDGTLRAVLNPKPKEEPKPNEGPK